MATQYTAGLTTGQVLTAATMNSIGAVSETFTPTWTASGTAPAIGNGTLTGRYFRIQKIVFVQMLFVAGSTTTYGTGNYSFSVPAGKKDRAALNGFMSQGISRLYDASSGGIYYGQASFFSGGTNTIIAYYVNNPLSATHPFTFAVNDEMYFQYQYEGA